MEIQMTCVIAQRSILPHGGFQTEAGQQLSQIL